MTPDDMEAVISEWLALASEVWPRCVPVSEGEIDALRALLLDYQKRGRALEEIKALPDLSKNPADNFDRGARAARLEAADIARATLKGKSHD
jgi:hypothetical protein